MRAHFAIVAIVLMNVPAACSEDTGGGDTIDDGSDSVDTSDGTDTAGDTADSTGDSTPPDTTPGETDATTPDTTDTRPGDTTQIVAVVINEVAPAGEPGDWIELYNAGDTEADLTGWLFRDDDPAHAYVFAAGTTLAPGEYLVIDRDDTGAAGFNFGLGGADAAFLFDVDQNEIDSTFWADGAAPVGRTWGRFPNGSGEFKTLLNPTREAANVDNQATDCGNGVVEGLEVCDGSIFNGVSCTTFGWGGGTLSCADDCARVLQTNCEEREPGLVINEVESEGDDRIEIFNGSANLRSLGNFVISDEGGGEYTIPSGTTIEAGGYFVLQRDVDHLFGLGDADTITLEDGEGQLVDMIGWPSGAAIPVWCRDPNGTGGFETCNEKSFGNENF